MTELLTIAEVSKKLKKARGSVYRYIADGVIPSELIINVNGSLLMKSSDLEKFLDSKKGKD